MLLCLNSNVEAGIIPKSVYSVPDEYSFDSVEDYANYEPQILETINWYLDTSMAFETDRRVKAKQFFIEWLTGTPDVSVGIDTDIVSFVNTSPELLVPYMMGWVKYSLENNYSKDEIKCCIAGIKTATKYYENNKFFFKDNEMIDKYKSMNDKKLAKYLSKFPSMNQQQK